MSRTQGTSGKGKPSGRGQQNNNGKNASRGASSPKSKSFARGNAPIKNVNQPSKKPSNPDEIRLNKYVANSGMCSRREADVHIATGLVTVNGKVITEMGYKVKLEDEVRAGRFREDLYYRLNVFPLGIPSLRERPGDIAPLARHFLGRHAQRAGRQARFSPEAEALLQRYGWPGNVRELENTAHRALILTPGDTVAGETIRLCLPHWTGEAAAVPAPAAPMLQMPQAQPAPPGFAGAHVSAPATNGNAAANFAGFAAQPSSETAARPANMKDLEREHILGTLREMGGSRKKTVEKLGISERTLRYKLQQYRDEGYEV